MEAVDKQKFIFALIFALSNKFQAIGDQYLGMDGVTTRQWFLMICIDQFRDNAPALSEVAELMSSSHQNVKQIALKLEKKGFVKIEKDIRDARILRLSLTEKCKSFWDSRTEKDNAFVGSLFQDLQGAELDTVYVAFNKLIDRVFKLEKDYLK